MTEKITANQIGYDMMAASIRSGKFILTEWLHIDENLKATHYKKPTQNPPPP